ncbi:MAG: AraC family transcriptional regulator [Planctomycetaceae bacterium]|nr:AraC family transcriptional regulator [Planctomycetaceae bacterium]
MKPNFEKILPSSDLSFRYCVRQEREFSFNWHHHNEYELTAIFKGRGQRFVGDSINNYNESDLVLIGPNVPHTWQSKKTNTTADNKACVIQFDKNFLGDVIWERPEFKIIRTLLNKSAAGICFNGGMRDEIIAQMLEMDGQQDFKKMLSLLDILDKLGGCKKVEVLSLKIFTKNINSEQSNRIDKVLEYLSKNYGEEINLTEVADSVHMSVSAFSRFFKRTTGKNYVNYLNELRINSACALLIETDMSILEICFKSGFQSLANFNRRFRQIKKMCPKEFRSQFSKPIF